MKMKECGWTGISCGVKGLYNLGSAGKGFYEFLESRVESQSAVNRRIRNWYKNSKFGGEFRPVAFPKVTKRYFPSWLPAHYVFSDKTKRNCGGKFAKYITENKLGQIVESPVAVNANSGNRIKTYIWVVDKDAVLNWFLSEYKAQNKKNKERQRSERKESLSSRN